MTGYDIYVQWCRERGRQPPTRAWWDNACAKNKLIQRTINAHYSHLSESERSRRLDNRELERANREDWYGNR